MDAVVIAPARGAAGRCCTCEARDEPENGAHVSGDVRIGAAWYGISSASHNLGDYLLR